jgi:hypothetical protein
MTQVYIQMYIKATADTDRPLPLQERSPGLTRRCFYFEFGDRRLLYGNAPRCEFIDEVGATSAIAAPTGCDISPTRVPESTAATRMSRMNSVGDSGNAESAL